MKAKRKVTSTIYLTEEQQVLLKELSEKSKVPVAEYIRQGVDLVLKKMLSICPVSFLLYWIKTIEKQSGIKNEPNPFAPDS